MFLTDVILVSDRAWFWRIWKLKSVLCCNDMYCETLSHFGSKELLRKVTNCAISGSAP